MMLDVAKWEHKNGTNMTPTVITVVLQRKIVPTTTDKISTM